MGGDTLGVFLLNGEGDKLLCEIVGVYSPVHHYKSGINSFGHYTVNWKLSNCEQGSRTCCDSYHRRLFNRHSTTINLVEEKQRGPKEMATQAHQACQ